MNSGKMLRGGSRVASGCCLAATLVASFVTSASAAERKFLVILANSPKQFPGTGQPPEGLPPFSDVNRQYFSKTPGDGIASFAEYWEEISYGDITIAGATTDWIILPWPIQPPAGNNPSQYLDMNGLDGDLFRYGTSERFNNFEAMHNIDINGNPGTPPVDDGPFTQNRQPGGNDFTPEKCEDTCAFAIDGECDDGGLGATSIACTYGTDCTDCGIRGGQPVWMPGHRFLDMDNDLRWDGLDETANVMDWDHNGRADGLGPWVDLDCNGEPNNASNDCIYLPDSDNNGRPDCCPTGPGTPECACPSLNSSSCGGDVADCNGNLIPDACDIAMNSNACRATLFDCNILHPVDGQSVCGRSTDALPIAPSNDAIPECNVISPDGVPDECQFGPSVNMVQICWNVDPITGALVNPVDDTCMGTPGTRGDCPPGLICHFSCTTEVQGPEDACNGFPGGACMEPEEANFPVRCEFDDINGNNLVDLVEPFESFFRIGDHRAMDQFGDPDPGIVIDPNTPDGAQYIRDNYPGDADKLILRSTPRNLFGEPDPLCLVGPMTPLLCSDFTSPIAISTCDGAGQILCLVDTDCPQGQTCPAPPQGMGSCDNNPSVACTLPAPPSKCGPSPACSGGLCKPAARWCKAGEHVAYSSPDRWFDVGTTKIRFDKIPVSKFTFQPSWYQQAWRDRYDLGGCGTGACDPPSWSPVVQQSLPYPATDRRYVSANRGGLFGNGAGWTPASNLQVVFTTESFENEIDRRILPEEVGGIGMPLITFDGYVEHDDLPSSKYHRAGDKRFGEVTSPNGNDRWGEDLAPVQLGGEGIIAAGGPYATRTHGDLNTDAGNVQNMELLTWRTGWDILGSRQPITPPPSFNNGVAWEGQYGQLLHPYAGPSGSNLGFRDYNLDGMLDQGEVPPSGSDNYLADTDPQLGLLPGTATFYPWNRQRLLEDCMEILDQLIDFDDYVDAASLAAVGQQGEFHPDQFQQTPNSFVTASGVLSGIVLLSAGSHVPGDFLTAPLFYPIHNEDNDDPAKAFPASPFGSQRINWNLFVHDLVIQINDVRSATAFQTAYSAHEYLHTWEGFPDLYDYDIYKPVPQPPINTPVGQWDIMAGSGQVPINLVHPNPLLKEKPGTEWIKPVDLATVLTPGVDSTITLPRSEFIRDNSHYFLENEDFLGERYYFWNVGAGFNQEFMPGSGMLILHANVGANPDALPSGQQNATNFDYLIVQADGFHQLESGIAPFGDAGDPWPGTSAKTMFNCTTNPASTWYNPAGQCSGLSISNIVPDGQGNLAVTFNWQPTNIPSLTFVDPPGGTSVPVSPTVERYKASFVSVDVFGGTTIRLFYIKEDTNDLAKLKAAMATNMVGQLNKLVPGRVQQSIDWNIKGLADGSYFLFAELVPGGGAGGTERRTTDPRPGRNNKGSGTLGNLFVDTPGQNARSETWVATCAKAATTTPPAPSEWTVTSSLTQPEPATGADQKALAGTTYTSRNGAVSFLITEGATPFAVGDTFTFVTTGITAISLPVTITGGVITENPIARIVANPLAGSSPLTVTFDGSTSFDPGGGALTYSWNFGDGQTASGPQVSHTFVGAQTFTVVLTVTNTGNGRSGSSSVDIVLSNNSPTAVLTVAPTSGSSPLTVTFSSNGSTDAETPNQLTYFWDFGDGTTSTLANPASKTYTAPAGQQQTFTVTLTVTDAGGKSDVKSATILVGNAAPVPNITFTALSGFDPLTVTFNGINSTDPDGDAINITWKWGDGQPDETYPRTGKPPATDGSVPHTFTLAANETSRTFNVTAVLTDARGGTSMWPGVQVTVNKAGPGSSAPRAIISAITPNPPVLNEPFTADGSTSFDRPTGNVASYEWDWGDGTAKSTGAKPTHTYTRAGTFTITLTVRDGETPANTGTDTVTVTVAGTGPGDQNDPPTAAFLVTPNQGDVQTVFTFDAGDSTDPEDDPLTYRWTFGDGSSGEGALVEHQYDEPGSYTVRLIVRDDSNASSDTSRTVVVTAESGNRAPVATIGTGPRSGPTPLTLMFNGQNSFDPDGDPLTFTWEFRQGETLIGSQTGEIITRRFDAVGTYTVELVVSDGELEDRTDRQTITVTTPPVDPGEEPPRPPPDDPAPLPVRPAGSICGIGMIMSLFWSMLGLAGLMLGRRRSMPIPRLR